MLACADEAYSKSDVNTLPRVQIVLASFERFLPNLGHLTRRFVRPPRQSTFLANRPICQMRNNMLDIIEKLHRPLRWHITSKDHGNVCQEKSISCCGMHTAMETALQLGCNITTGRIERQL